MRSPEITEELLAKRQEEAFVYSDSALRELRELQNLGTDVGIYIEMVEETQRAITKREPGIFFPSVFK